MVKITINNNLLKYDKLLMPDMAKIDSIVF